MSLSRLILNPAGVGAVRVVREAHGAQRQAAHQARCSKGQTAVLATSACSVQTRTSTFEEGVPGDVVGRKHHEQLAGVAQVVAQPARLKGEGEEGGICTQALLPVLPAHHLSAALR